MSKKDKAAKPGKHSEKQEKAAKKQAATPSSETAPQKEQPKAPKGHLDERQFMLISKALADPTRMSVLRAIASGGATCGGMKDCTGISAATLSHHMKELETAGLIDTERNGRSLSATLQRKAWKAYLSELKSIGE